MTTTKPGKSARRERENEQRHEAMIEVAVELFASGGYFGTRIEEIADAAEFSRSAVYLHFPGGKEELYAAAMTRAVQCRTQVIAEALQARNDKKQTRLHVVWQALEQFYEQHPNYVRLLGSLGSDDIRKVIPSDALHVVMLEGTKTFRLMDQTLRSDWTTPNELRELPRFHLAWSVWSSFMGTVQFAESLIHIGHDVDMGSLLASTLATLEPAFL